MSGGEIFGVFLGVAALAGCAYATYVLLGKGKKGGRAKRSWKVKSGKSRTVGGGGFEEEEGLEGKSPSRIGEIFVKKTNESFSDDDESNRNRAFGDRDFEVFR